MSCLITEYCLSNTGNPTYDNNYSSGGTYDSNSYYTGETNGLFIYYSTGSTQWFLSSSLGGSCLLSGKSPCYDECPDLSTFYCSSGICPTPTPTPSVGCGVLDFTSLFDCDIELTATPTPTPSSTPTPTPTPTATDSCGSLDTDVTIDTYTPQPTPTQTVTPTSSDPINRTCNFFGDVTFNTLEGSFDCPISKKFQDCINGKIYYTTNNIITPNGEGIEEFMVFNSNVNGEIKCISFLGTTTQVIGVDSITLLSGPYGYSNLGGCISCQVTPTPTPTITPAPMMCFDVVTESYGYFWQCSISFTGYYNGKPYYILLDPNCSTPLSVNSPDLTFVVWNSTLSRWEVVSALSIGSIGSGIICLTNNNPSNYPETSGIYSWIDAGPGVIDIAFSVQGTCPILLL